MEKITVDFDNLTEEDRAKLIALVEKSQKKPSDFDIKIGEKYYVSLYNGKIDSYTFADDALDKMIIRFGNASKNKAYIEKRAREIKLYNLLSNFAWELYGGEAFKEEDWKSRAINKYLINKDGITGKYETTYYCVCSNINSVYFRTREDAQRAIDEIVIPFERGEL